ncbi:hypothetical protein C0Q70_13573 [Pomacea canaliculata]|uniref:Uncharacterized protein n=1 Tax=Pomacea canaliculata TaxID=400727 RepID=A0A2T7NXL3_POMCA|nr:hypothetical protein C0Q70_13573 [Pomacea canaliculata]
MGLGRRHRFPLAPPTSSRVLSHRPSSAGAAGAGAAGAVISTFVLLIDACACVEITRKKKKTISSLDKTAWPLAPPRPRTPAGLLSLRRSALGPTPTSTTDLVTFTPPPQPPFCPSAPARSQINACLQHISTVPNQDL